MLKTSSQEPYDNEKGDSPIDEVYAVEDAPDEAIVKRFGALGPLLDRLFKVGVEARGVERVPEHQRDPKFLWNSLFMWWSVDMTLTTIPVGVLAQFTFSLTLPHAIATLLCFSALSSMATAFIATLGPKTGLRTMVIARYSSGHIGCIFFSVLNVLSQFGFCATSVIVAGQTLSSINPHALSLVGAIIIISACSLVPCFVGYDMVHVYERYAWIMVFIIICCLYGLGSHVGYDVNAQKALEHTGRELSASILSFGSACFGAACWVNAAADYTVCLPVNTKASHIFVLTFLGVYLPTVFAVALGATLMTITDPTYVAAFGADGNAGALIAQVLAPWKGGGKFILVLLSFSAIAINVVGTYSAALSVQALGRPFAMVPRFIWVTLIVVVYTIAGVVGREHFSVILNNVLSMLSYWTAIFFVLIVEEHFIFRRQGGRLGGYHLADWDKPSKLPLGIAGMSACIFGVVGAVVGMSQVYYTGPLGKLAGATSGADIGLELAAGFTAVTFPPLRWLEIRLSGR